MAVSRHLAVRTEARLLSWIMVGSYPFTAIVGQDALKRALVLNATNPAIGGVLIQGSSGTAKSTAVRGLAAVMPQIEVSKECPFNCSPQEPCLRCREMSSLGDPPELVRRRARVVDLPLNATEDRLAGALDLSRALRDGEKALEPGLLAAANRGILYVDEINLLDDHLVDLMLDAAASGINTVEREGVSATHPASFILVGTMNEDEGELRPQLADRLGLTVRVSPLNDGESRTEIMRRREQYTHDADAFAESWRESEESLGRTIQAAHASISRVRVPDPHYEAIAELVVTLGIASHRADITVLECAKASAALDGRNETTLGDIADAGALALDHRRAVEPFSEDAPLEASELQDMLEDLLKRPGTQKKTHATPR